nr:proton-conducting transporter membrane subunit [Paracoccus saliphilus]
MTQILPLSFLAPALLLAAALVATAFPRLAALPRLAEATALATLTLAGAGVVQLTLTGAQVLSLMPGLTLRLDAVGATMALLVAFVGWIVVRYARSYLVGEAGAARGHAGILASLAFVLVLVQAGDLVLVTISFLAIGLVMRQLLLFYPDRPEARRAAAKFSRVWGAGDLALAVAALSAWQAFGTTDLQALNDAARAAPVLPLAAKVAVAALVLAALLKTASFPLHGWLTEVMEAPTPFSALLHAGIINGGGLLLIRTADLVQASPGAMAALVMLGGLTALFGAAVMLTQSAVKTALAWSTIAQMGFMLLQCGLGLWALALLHIVAHSLYKAHGFLASGQAVQAVAAARRPGPVAVPGVGAVARAFALALVLYAAVAFGFWAIGGPKSAQALALGAILIFGTAYLVAQGLADAAPMALTRRTAVASLAAGVGYFGFHLLAALVWGPHLPKPPVPGALEWALIVLALTSFGLVAVAQALFPLWAHHPASAALRVHLANGLYLNAIFDRLIGGFRAVRSH